MVSNFYIKDNKQLMAQLKELAPEQLKAFNDFNTLVFKNGALTIKEKEIIAVAITMVTQCPYCIDSHTKKAKKGWSCIGRISRSCICCCGH